MNFFGYMALALNRFRYQDWFPDNSNVSQIFRVSDLADLYCQYENIEDSVYFYVHH